MLRFVRQALGAALAGCVLCDATAAPALKILYHEALRVETREAGGHTRSMTFEAYGRRFNLHLSPNEGVRRAVPAGRSDIEPLRGALEGQAGSWVRMTRTRSGWRGIVFDGQDMYAIEPARDIAGALVQPLAAASGASPVIYRLKDALLPMEPAYCEIATPDHVLVRDTAIGGAMPPSANGSSTGRVTAQMLYDAMAADVSSASSIPSVRLMVGIVADYEFFQEYSEDPEGTIISRMDIVDGVYSSQVGVKISLTPLTIIRSAAEPFTKTEPNGLLSEVRQYRGAHSVQMGTGVTHLMTGKNLDGDVVGISYMGAVCDGDTADSLSEGNHSSLMSALIAAHEIGHNFNAPHDGVPGACASTPQIYLMAPQINFSSQFSECSLEQIHLRMQTAQCLTPYEAPDVAVELPETLIGAVLNSSFKLSFTAHAIGDDPSNAVSATAALPSNLTLQSVSVTNGQCSSDGPSVTCSLGNLNANETRQVELSLVGTAAGSSSVTVSVASSNDTITANNSAQVSVQISPPDPGTASASGGSAGGDSGGGGGRLDFLLLAILGCAAGAAATRNARSATHAR